MRAIDLYAGIGGWSLGLRLAGVEVVASYEWWQPAIDTHNGNLGGALIPIDIRKLDLGELPVDIDLVVGSPPCTEFSYANRGGNGNLAEGMKDLVKFFEIVAYLRPRFWAMENVPRVAEVLTRAFEEPEHPLYKFRDLNAEVEVIDFSDYGTPQARRRCIATNIPLERIQLLKGCIPQRTLGDVVEALSAEKTVIDPVWGVALDADNLTETEAEQPLNPEELRMNREAKAYHPVYNNMAFPDHLDAPARTVTATCTRVSRESVVIADRRSLGQFRRLTIRERASLQGFPITYQFFAKSFAEKAKMIGNAIPPTITHLLALAARGTLSKEFSGFEDSGRDLKLPDDVAPITLPDKEGRSYPLTRSFRAALPHLRFKSGMRFDLSNDVSGPDAIWRVRFFFGSSKDIREIELDGAVTRDLLKSESMAEIIIGMESIFQNVERELLRTAPEFLQQVWAHKADGLSPFDVTDHLGQLAKMMHDQIVEVFGDDERPAIEDFVIGVAEMAANDKRLVSEAKLRKNATWILTGFVIADWFNSLPWHLSHRKAA